MLAFNISLLACLCVQTQRSSNYSVGGMLNHTSNSPHTHQPPCQPAWLCVQTQRSSNSLGGMLNHTSYSPHTHQPPCQPACLCVQTQRSSNSLDGMLNHTSYPSRICLPVCPTQLKLMQLKLMQLKLMQLKLMQLKLTRWDAEPHVASITHLCKTRLLRLLSRTLRLGGICWG